MNFHDNHSITVPILPLKTTPAPDGTFVLSEEDRRHWIKVRRMKSGSHVVVLLPDGSKAQAELWEERGQWQGRIQKTLSVDASDLLPCHLGVGMVRWPRMEWLVEKGAELGLPLLTPLYCQRGKYPPGDRLSPHKMARLNKIAEETQKQSEGNVATRIQAPQKLFDWVREIKNQPGRKIFLDEAATLPRLIPELLRPAATAYFFLVGPEGGFAPEEREEILACDFQSVSLGGKLLKTETAALYALITLDAALISL
jgi:16S rRNA (uracil1498-N3)-methyltransferase